MSELVEIIKLSNQVGAQHQDQHKKTKNYSHSHSHPLVLYILKSQITIHQRPLTHCVYVKNLLIASSVAPLGLVATDKKVISNEM